MAMPWFVFYSTSGIKVYLKFVNLWILCSNFIVNCLHEAFIMISFSVRPSPASWITFLWLLNNHITTQTASWSCFTFITFFMISFTFISYPSSWQPFSWPRNESKTTVITFWTSRFNVAFIMITLWGFQRQRKRKVREIILKCWCPV